MVLYYKVREKCIQFTISATREPKFSTYISLKYSVSNPKILLKFSNFRIAPAAAAAASNPYLQQMYAAAAAASNPYALQGTGLISLAQNPMAGAAAGAPASTGNPLLDAYGQYAALAAAGVYTTSASATGSSFTSPLDTAQAASKFY